MDWWTRLGDNSRSGIFHPNLSLLAFILMAMQDKFMGGAQSQPRSASLLLKTHSWMLKVRWSQCLWQSSLASRLSGWMLAVPNIPIPSWRAESLWGVRWAESQPDMTYQSQVTAHNGMVICIRHTQPQHQQQQHTKALPTTSLGAAAFVNCMKCQIFWKPFSLNI